MADEKKKKNVGKFGKTTSTVHLSASAKAKAKRED